MTDAGLNALGIRVRDSILRAHPDWAHPLIPPAPGSFPFPVEPDCAARGAVLAGSANFAGVAGQGPAVEKDFGSDASPDRPYVEFTDFDGQASSLRAAGVDLIPFCPAKSNRGTRLATQLHKLIAPDETNTPRPFVCCDASHFIQRCPDAGFKTGATTGGTHQRRAGATSSNCRQSSEDRDPTRWPG